MTEPTEAAPAAAPADPAPPAADPSPPSSPLTRAVKILDDRDARASAEGAQSPAEPAAPSPGPDGAADGGQSPPAAAEAPESAKTEPPTKQETKIAAQLARLSRREAEIRRKEAEITSRSEKEAALLAGLRSDDPAELARALEEATGRRDTIERVARHNLGKKEDPTSVLERKIEALEARLEAEASSRVQSAEEAAEAAREQAKDGLRGSIASVVEAGGDSYELIRWAGAEGEVFELIEQHFLATHAEGSPVLLTPEQAANIIEEQLASRLGSLSSVSKIKGIFGATAAPGEGAAPAETPASEMAPPETVPGTLTNQSAATRATTEPKGPPLPLRDRMRRAKAILDK